MKVDATAAEETAPCSVEPISVSPTGDGRVLTVVPALRHGLVPCLRRKSVLAGSMKHSDAPVIVTLFVAPQLSAAVHPL
jgi:hypothetical protein